MQYFINRVVGGALMLFVLITLATVFILACEDDGDKVLVAGVLWGLCAGLAIWGVTAMIQAGLLP